MVLVKFMIKFTTVASKWINIRTSNGQVERANENRDGSRR